MISVLLLTVVFRMNRNIIDGGFTCVLK